MADVPLVEMVVESVRVHMLSSRHVVILKETDRDRYFTAEQAKAQALQTQIDKTDKEIDALVYELYDPTEAETAAVEGIP